MSRLSVSCPKWLAVAVLATAFGLGSANTSQAAFVFVGSRATLAGTDSLDWGTKGAALTTLTNPFSITSTGGVVATVSQATGIFLRADEGISGWNGHFALGDKLLLTNYTNNGNNGPMTITFGTALSGAGAKMHTDFPTTFTATVEALAANGSVLASFTYTGTGGLGSSDDIAPFAGISTTGGSTFFALRYTGVSGVTNPNDFAINKFDFRLGQAPLTNAVPVPAGMILALSGLPALGFAGWVRRRFTTAA